MMAAFIEPDSLAALNGGTLFYPSAGEDWNEFLDLFSDHVDEFLFSDIKYNFDRKLPSPFSNPAAYKLLKSNIQGRTTTRLIRNYGTAENGRTYSFLDPGRLTEVYENVLSRKRITVIRRRGFGQYALAEIPDHSIKIFVHRGDSPGESGSNVYYLGNVRRRHPPLSNLFNTLTKKLANRALVVSDGSNTSFKFLRKFHRIYDWSGEKAFAYQRNMPPRRRGPFEWRCVGYISSRYGPTLVWDIKRVDGSPVYTLTQ